MQGETSWCAQGLAFTWSRTHEERRVRRVTTHSQQHTLIAHQNFLTLCAIWHRPFGVCLLRIYQASASSCREGGHRPCALWTRPAYACCGALQAPQAPPSRSSQQQHPRPRAGVLSRQRCRDVGRRAEPLLRFQALLRVARAGGQREPRRGICRRQAVALHRLPPGQPLLHAAFRAAGVCSERLDGGRVARAVPGNGRAGADIGARLQGGVGQAGPVGPKGDGSLYNARAGGSLLRNFPCLRVAMLNEEPVCAHGAGALFPSGSC